MSLQSVYYIKRSKIYKKNLKTNKILLVRRASARKF